ncbi:hypothetical protein V6N11_032761 [Hibiscus sabdariffa]|uniref:DUF4220 domain-containing protein n=1 Tax=Hibiscus sabdariffa TaxID=183260 RepID=A0ABR2T1L7_9ROSI
MIHKILPIIPPVVIKLWDVCGIRGAILTSLLLQILLFLVAPFRKSCRNFGVWLIWLAYVFADAIPKYVVGLISNSQRNQDNKLEQKADIFAFWAAFLLLHMGGADSITAFALEDNELWRRHLLSLGVQAAAVISVFIQTFPNGNLWIPTLLVFFAGIIKGIERLRNLRMASMDKLQDFMRRKPDPGPNYAKLMQEYELKRAAGIPTQSILTAEPDHDEDKAFATLAKEGKLNSLEVVHYAGCFRRFTRLVTDLNLSDRLRNESRNFFLRRSADDTLKVMQVELNFIYGLVYTKFLAFFGAGFLFRVLAFGSVLATLGIFHFKTKKDDFSGVDIVITYALLLGAIALDLTAYFMSYFSDCMAL